MNKSVTTVTGVVGALLLLIAAIGILKDAVLEADNPRSPSPYLDIGSQYGLQGVDFDTLLVESRHIEAGTPYQLPANTYWADAFAGDDGTAWPVLKVWQADGQPHTQTDPVTYNWATAKQGMLALQLANQAGHLTITVPKNQHDLSTGRDTITSATLIVVTKR